MNHTKSYIPIDKELKEAAEAILKQRGLNVTDAVNQFLQQIVSEEEMPYSEPEDDPEGSETQPAEYGSYPDDETLYAEAVRFALTEKEISTSRLQRRFCIGYNRAIKIIDRMQAENIIRYDPEICHPRRYIAVPEASGTDPDGKKETD